MGQNSNEGPRANRPFGGHMTPATQAYQSGNEIASPLAELTPQVAKMYPDSDWAVYIRKSNVVGELANAGYLQFQEASKGMLVACGVPEHRIIELSADIGMSGRLDTQFRLDLKRLEVLIKTGLKNVMIADIARLFRDSSGLMPTIFANMMHVNDVRVLTADSGDWEVMEMGNRDVADRFIAVARVAAKYLETLRNVTVKGKEIAVGRGAWSGAAVPLGWALTPKSRKLNKLGRMEDIDSAMFLYAPHATVKKRIMLIADHRTVQDWSELLRIVIAEECYFDPFLEVFALPDDPHFRLRDYMATRSCMTHARPLNDDGKRERYNPNERFMCSRTMLINVLLEPLTVGIRTYGSGDRGGKAKLVLETKRYEQMYKKLDSKIRDYRVPIDDEPQMYLALLTTDEDIELYWRLYEKWGKYDATILRESGFADPQPRKSFASTRTNRGRVASHHGRTTLWGGLVYCGMHGFKDNGEANLSHHMQCSTNDATWQCNKENLLQLSPVVCSNVGNHDIIHRCLTTVFRLRATAAVQRLQWRTAAALDKGGSQPGVTLAEAQIVRINADIKRLQEEVNAEEDTLKSRRRGWRNDEMTEEEVESEADNFIERRVKPLDETLKQSRLQLKRAQDKAQTANAELLRIQQAQDLLAPTLERWDTMTNPFRNEMVQYLIDQVVVYSLTGPTAREVIIHIYWRDGTIDSIVSWRGPGHDVRPWESWEDEALHQYWSSGCSVDEMRAQLQPYRKYSSVRSRAETLGIKYPNRTQAWRALYEDKDRSYGDRNKETLCFARWQGAASAHWTQILSDGREGLSGPLPLDVERGMSEVMEIAMKRARLAEVLPPDDDDDDDGGANLPVEPDTVPPTPTGFGLVQKVLTIAMAGATLLLRKRWNFDAGHIWSGSACSSSIS